MLFLHFSFDFLFILFSETTKPINRPQLKLGKSFRILVHLAYAKADGKAPPPPFLPLVITTNRELPSTPQGGLNIQPPSHQFWAPFLVIGSHLQCQPYTTHHCPTSFLHHPCLDRIAPRLRHPITCKMYHCVPKYIAILKCHHFVTNPWDREYEECPCAMPRCPLPPI